MAFVPRTPSPLCQKGDRHLRRNMTDADKISPGLRAGRPTSPVVGSSSTLLKRGKEREGEKRNGQPDETKII